MSKREVMACYKPVGPQVVVNVYLYLCTDIVECPLVCIVSKTSSMVLIIGLSLEALGTT